MKNPPLPPLVVLLIVVACALVAPLAWLFLSAFLMDVVQKTSPVMSSGDSLSNEDRMAPAFVLLFVVLPVVGVLGGATARAVMAARSGPHRGAAWAALLCGGVGAVLMLLCVPMMVRGGWGGRAPAPSGIAAIVNTVIVWTVAVGPVLWAMGLALWGWRTKNRPPE